jgi:hypothetical protein
MTATLTGASTDLRATNALSADQVAFYHANGFLRIERVFSAAEIDELADALD